MYAVLVFDCGVLLKALLPMHNLGEAQLSPIPSVFANDEPITTHLLFGQA